MPQRLLDLARRVGAGRSARKRLECAFERRARLARETQIERTRLQQRADAPLRTQGQDGLLRCAHLWTRHALRPLLRRFAQDLRRQDVDRIGAERIRQQARRSESAVRPEPLDLAPELQRLLILPHLKERVE